MPSDPRSDAPRKRRGLLCWLFGCLWETYQRVGPAVTDDPRSDAEARYDAFMERWGHLRQWAADFAADDSHAGALHDAFGLADALRAFAPPAITAEDVKECERMRSIKRFATTAEGDAFAANFLNERLRASAPPAITAETDYEPQPRCGGALKRGSANACGMCDDCEDEYRRGRESEAASAPRQETRSEKPGDPDERDVHIDRDLLRREGLVAAPPPEESKP